MMEMGKFIEEMTKAGVLLATGGLDPNGIHIKSSGGEITVTDGPFAEAKEAVVGFALIDVRTQEEAVERRDASGRSSGTARARSARSSAHDRSREARPARKRTGPRAPGLRTNRGGALMGRVTVSDTDRAIEAVWRIESARIIAGLTRIVRDVGLAEELAQDALVVALEKWPGTGVPDNPGAWLMATAKHRAIDEMRRDRRLQVRARTARARAGDRRATRPRTRSTPPRRRRGR